MKRIIFPVLVLLLVSGVFIAGCSSSAPAPAPTAAPAPETPAPVETPPPATPAVTVTAAPTTVDEGPIEYLPTAQTVNFELTKDRPTSKIHLLYQGGAGTMFTQKVVMRVYTSDGQVEEYIMKDGERPAAGDEIVARGTKGADRCVVYITSAGTTYKVIDKKLYSDL
jgi:hypothetical protein